VKVGITVDDIPSSTTYVVGKYDFYTRTIDLPDGVAEKVQLISELNTVAQRVLAAAYNSNGRFILPEDLERLGCVNVESPERVTPEVASAKQRKKQASAAPSSSEWQKISNRTE